MAAKRRKRRSKRNRAAIAPPPPPAPAWPTQLTRDQVQTMAGLGLTDEEICLLIVDPSTETQISLEQLHASFAKELATGVVIANAAVLQSIHRASTQPGPGQAAAWKLWAALRLGLKTGGISVDPETGVLM